MHMHVRTDRIERRNKAIAPPLHTSWPGRKALSMMGRPRVVASAMVPGPAFVTTQSTAPIHSSMFDTKPFAKRFHANVAKEKRKRKHGTISKTPPHAHQMQHSHRRTQRYRQLRNIQASTKGLTRFTVIVGARIERSQPIVFCENVITVSPAIWIFSRPYLGNIFGTRTQPSHHPVRSSGDFSPICVSRSATSSDGKNISKKAVTSVS